MPRAKKQEGATERQRFEVLLEEIRGDVKQLKDGHAHLDQRIEQEVGQLQHEMQQEFVLVKLAIKENTQAIKGMQVELTTLTQHVDEHLKAHAT